MIVCTVNYYKFTMPLEVILQQYLDQAEIVKGLNQELKEKTQEQEIYPAVQQKMKELKDMKSKLNESPEVMRAKEARDVEKERMNLLREMLIAQMTQTNQPEVTSNGKKAIMIPTMKIERE
jgi:hypothetical protein